MNEKQMHLVMMIASAIITCVAGLGAVGVLVTASGLLGGVLPAFLLVALAVGSGWTATYFGRQLTGDNTAFTQAEQAVLFPHQRHELRKARAEVLLQKSLVEVEDERDKLVTRQLEASKPDEERETQVVHRPQPIQPDPAWNGKDPIVEPWNQ